MSKRNHRFSCLGGAVLSAITAMVYGVRVSILPFGILITLEKKALVFLSFRRWCIRISPFLFFNINLLEYDGQVLDIQAKSLRKAKPPAIHARMFYPLILMGVT